MKYLKQFDSIRGIAVLFVLLYHWSPREFHSSIPPGFNIVDLFFVLSGYLISLMLFDAKNKVAVGEISRQKAFSVFYIGRILRIFPIYYLLLILEYFAHHIDINRFISLLTYTFNFYSYKAQVWDDRFAHLWSLSVEEQFYLIWPIVIIFTPKKWMLQIIICFMAIGSITEYLFRDNLFGTALPFTCFDSLALGAFLAWVITEKPLLFKKIYIILTIISFCLSCLFISGILLHSNYFLSSHFLLSILAAWFIYFIVNMQNNRSHNLISGILNVKPLMNLGKMTYGIYLYHFATFSYSWHVLIPLNSLLPNFLTRTVWLFYAENLIFLVLIAWLSKKYIERPIMHLKQRIIPGRSVVKLKKAEQLKIAN